MVATVLCRDQLLLRAGRTKRVGEPPACAGNALKWTTLPPWTRAAASTPGATTVRWAPSPISGPTAMLLATIDRNQPHATAFARATAGRAFWSRVANDSA